MFKFRCCVDDKLIHKYDLNGLSELNAACGLIIWKSILCHDIIFLCHDKYYLAFLS